MTHLKTWLQYLDDKAVETFGSTAAWVCANPVTFSTSEQKNGWQGFEQSINDRLAITRVTKLGHHGAKTWLMFCDTPPESYVGKEVSEEEKKKGVKQWDKVDMAHAWALAIVNTKKDGKGKTLFIFDCDQPIPTAAYELSVKALVTQRERRFCEELKKLLSIDAVFVGNYGADRAGQDQCVDEATRWVEEVAGKDGVSLEEDRARFDGFVELKW